MLENWQSEYLQFSLYIVGTVWLLQTGSPESKPLDKAGGESDEDQKVGGTRRRLARLGARRRLAHAAVLQLAAVRDGDDLAALLARPVDHRPRRLQRRAFDHQQAPISWPQYVGTPDFWNRTLQNWQSEFLAVGSMAVLAIYLRQRGSPESKPVGTPHTATGAEG